MANDTISDQAADTKDQVKPTARRTKQTPRTTRSSAGRGGRPTAAKSSGTKARERTRQGSMQARTAARQAERTLTTVLADGVYATVGATDSAIGFVRSLPRHTMKVRVPSPGALRDRAAQEFDQLAGRGREVIDTIQTAPATKRAVTQTRAARQQFRSATGQTRRAAQDTVDALSESASAVEQAAERVGAADKV